MPQQPTTPLLPKPSRTARWLRSLTTPPAHIPTAYARVWVLLSVGLTSAVAVHVLYVGFFAAVGAWWLVAANLLSFPLYGVALAQNQRGRAEVAAYLAGAELWYHQTLAVGLVGWDSGLQYFLLVLPAVLFSLPGRNFVPKTAVTGATAALFAGLWLWTRAHGPYYALPPSVLVAMNMVSLLGIFGLLGLFAQQFARAAEVAEADLRRQYDRAERLLHNILPVPIAERLKAGGGIIADGVAESTVLFADLVGFTQLSSTMAPQQLVRVLNDLFSAFDELIEMRGLEKIKTIGDAYMVAAGIPDPHQDHAGAAVELAFAMQETLRVRAGELGLPLQMRIGMHSGPVVAGVIGTRKFIYDLWGDTVNIASRMESHGLPGEIQVTRATRELLGERFAFELRGTIAVKGKGEMEAFLVRRASL